MGALISHCWPPSVSRPVLIAVLGLAAAAAVILAASLDSVEDVSQAGQPSASSAPDSAVARSPEITAEPLFDIIRIGQARNAVLAGRAAAKSHVIVHDGMVELGDIQADESGEWVLVPEQPLPTGPHVLTIQATAPDEDHPIISAPVIVAIPDDGDDPTLALALSPSGDARFIVGAENAPTALSIDLTDISRNGALLVGGRAPKGITVQISLDGHHLARTVANEQGAWSVVAKAGKAGALKAESLDRDDKVTQQVHIALPWPSASAPADMVVEAGPRQWTIERPEGTAGSGLTTIHLAEGKTGQRPR